MGKTLEVWLTLQNDMRLSTVNIEKLVAGIFAGSGALLLIYQGYVTEGCIILGTMLGFFVGDWNGQKKAEKA